MPNNVFTKLHNSQVMAVLTYVAAISGTKEHRVINKAKNQACRFSGDVGKYTSNDVINGDMVNIAQWKKCP